MDSDSEVSWEEEHAILHKTFPKAKFCVCLSLKELEHVLSTEPEIVLKCSHNCYCYDKHPRPSDYFFVKRKGNSILVKDAIQALQDAKYDPMCNHTFLEGFEKTKDSDIQFSVFFGS
jgi:hypothetical protein